MLHTKGLRSGILFERLALGTGMFLKHRLHDPEQTSVKRTPQGIINKSNIKSYLRIMLVSIKIFHSSIIHHLHSNFNPADSPFPMINHLIRPSNNKQLKPTGEATIF